MDRISIGETISRRWEACRLKAYKPLPTDPWTIGWGATGPGIIEGTVWTQQQADGNHHNRFVTLASQLAPLVKVPVTDNQFGAMLSLTDNIGLTAFTNSTLLRLLNQGDTKGASQQFLVWNKSAGKYVQGLMNRREDEKHVFDSLA